MKISVGQPTGSKKLNNTCNEVAPGISVKFKDGHLLPRAVPQFVPVYDTVTVFCWYFGPLHPDTRSRVGRNLDIRDSARNCR